MTSAYRSTSLTCSPNREKSAERIDAESLPTQPSLPGAGCRTAERRREHRVASVAVRPQAMSFGGPVRTFRGHGLEIGPMPKERIHRSVGLGTREGADRVYERASGSQQIGRRARDRDLEPREAGQLILRRAPQELGPAP